MRLPAVTWARRTPRPQQWSWFRAVLKTEAQTGNVMLLAWTHDLCSDSMSCTLASQDFFCHENACGR